MNERVKDAMLHLQEVCKAEDCVVLMVTGDIKPAGTDISIVHSGYNIQMGAVLSCALREKAELKSMVISAIITSNHL